MSHLIEALVDWFGFRWIWRRFRGAAERSSEPWRSRARSGRELDVPGDVASAVHRVGEVARRYGDERPTSETQRNDVIEVVTPANWKSSGSVVRLMVEPSNNGVRVVITAWPGAQLFDWGESRRVADAICDELAVAE